MALQGVGRDPVEALPSRRATARADGHRRRARRPRGRVHRGDEEGREPQSDRAVHRSRPRVRGCGSDRPRRIAPLYQSRPRTAEPRGPDSGLAGAARCDTGQGRPAIGRAVAGPRRPREIDGPWRYPPGPEARDPGTSASRDEAASWLDEHGDALYRYAGPGWARRELAEDLVQDTFVAALQSRGRYRDSSVRTWLLSILKHKIVDHHRRLAASPRPGELAKAVDDPTRSAGNSSGRWPWAARRHPGGRPTRPSSVASSGRCSTAASAGSRALASVFLLRELEGLGIEDLRRTLGLSDANIRVRLHRAASAAPRMPGASMVLGDAGEADMSRPNGLRWLLTLRCESASELASRELDEPLSRGQGAPGPIRSTSGSAAPGSSTRPASPATSSTRRSRRSTTSARSPTAGRSWR